jgi:hypothetical protein
LNTTPVTTQTESTNERNILPNTTNTLPNELIKLPKQTVTLPNETKTTSETITDDKSELTIPNDESELTIILPNGSGILPKESTTSTLPVLATQHDISDTEETPYVCFNEARHHFRNLEANAYHSYCKEGNRFYDIHCKGQGCNNKFVDKKGGTDTFRPSMKYPMYVCPNAARSCTYALCNKCYTTLLIA